MLLEIRPCSRIAIEHMADSILTLHMSFFKFDSLYTTMLGWAVVETVVTAAQVGIDDALVMETKEEIFELNNGCVCCTGKHQKQLVSVPYQHAWHTGTLVGPSAYLHDLRSTAVSTSKQQTRNPT